ncbi:MAG TPA: hypothetical protein VMF57_06045 [Solirubrobacteraceae bacterium]|nr:hypothetical protein [Solirubrobacteraceae bacterium]
MRRRVRDLGHQPIADRDRQRLFWLLATVVVATAVLLLASRPTRPAAGGVARQQTIQTTTASARETAPVPPAVTRRTAGPAPTASATPLQAARTFLRGYVALLYGQARRPQLANATPQLRHALLDQALVVPPAQRQLHPTVLSLTATRAGRGWRVRAAVADGGVAHYPIVLNLTHAAGGGWLVSGVS